MDVSKEKIAELREQHIRRYSNMIRSGGLNVRVWECENLISIWRSTEDKEYAELSPDAKGEVIDAIMDEEDS